MLDETLLALFSRFDQALEDEEVQVARVCLEELTSALGDDEPEVAYCKARLSWLLHGDDVGIEELLRVVEQDPDHAEAHYDLGCLFECRDQMKRAVTHFLRVRALDAMNDREQGLGSEDELDGIEQVAREVIDGLPAPFLERLSHVPVLIERRPSRALVESGFDPRAFGLFEGPTDGMQGEPMPTRIVLYAANLLAEFTDEDTLREQVEVTVLHEIGHYFGLSEEDLERLGLD